MHNLTLLCLAVLLLAGCDASEPEPDQRGRIVLGVSVDGVSLGADTLDVYRLLGTPSRVRREPGRVRFLYESGDHAGMEIYYDIRADGSAASSSAISLTRPYAGQTGDGMGIGTPRAQVTAALGDPVSSIRSEQDEIHDTYRTANGNSLLFIFSGDRIRLLGMAGRSAPANLVPRTDIPQ